MSACGKDTSSAGAKAHGTAELTVSPANLLAYLLTVPPDRITGFPR